MNRKAWLSLMVALAATQGCAMSPEKGQQDSLVYIDLKPSRVNAGEIGRATLVEQGDKTGIVFFISGASSWASLPLHLYTFIYPGNCAALGTKPAYEMNQIVRTDSWGGGWQLSKRVPVSLETLRGGDYSIVMRTSPADGRRDIFCGEII